MLSVVGVMPLAHPVYDNNTKRDIKRMWTRPPMTHETNAPLPLEIDAHVLKSIQTNNLNVAFIDVRMPWEVAQAPAGDSPNIPLNQLPQNIHALPQADHLVIICAHGNRSLMAAQWLRQNGFATAQSLMGGMASWRRFKEMAA